MIIIWYFKVKLQDNLFSLTLSQWYDFHFQGPVIEGQPSETVNDDDLPLEDSDPDCFKIVQGYLSGKIRDPIMAGKLMCDFNVWHFTHCGHVVSYK